MAGNYLRYWRDHAGLTQKQLARAIGKDWRTVWRWEKGADIKIKDQRQLADLFGIEREELLFGPEHASKALVAPPQHFEEDAAPYDPEAVAASREGLRPGDLAIFDIGGNALAALHDGRAPDGAVVMAQTYDDRAGAAETILRQWIGPWPGLLVTNRPGMNAVASLSLCDNIRVKGVLKRSLRSHAGAPLALPKPD